MSDDPTDEIAENAIKNSQKYKDPYVNSIDPPGIEGTGLGKKDEEYIEFVEGEEKNDPDSPAGSTKFERLRSSAEDESTEDISDIS